MKDRSILPAVGYASLLGGAVALLLAPIMVIIKYMTGWNVVPKPAWIDPTQEALGRLLGFGPPSELWMAYGSLYTLALLSMLAGFVGLYSLLKNDEGTLQTKGYWIVLVGLVMVILGDAVHTWTWHQNGLTTPTPGTNPVANTAYAVHMMGMNFIMAGSVWVGVAALRRKLLARWLAWMLVLIFPSAVIASITILPTTPSGALWLFSLMMGVCGYLFATGKNQRLAYATRVN